LKCSKIFPITRNSVTFDKNQSKLSFLAYRLCHCIRSIWTHGPPPAQSLHLLIALLQLFAHQTMLAQLYRYGFINSGKFNFL